MLPEAQRVSPPRDQGGESKHELLGESFGCTRPWDPAQPPAVPHIPQRPAESYTFAPLGAGDLYELGCALQAKAELSSRKGLVGQELASPCGSISKGSSPQLAPLS